MEPRKTEKFECDVCGDEYTTEEGAEECAEWDESNGYGDGDGIERGYN